MTISVLVNGAFGRMGQFVTKAIENDPRFTLVGQTGREYDLKKSIQDCRAEVVIDFTHADFVFNNTEVILSTDARPVIGTSGLTQSDVAKLQLLAKKHHRGGIIAPNFSLGAVLMMKYAQTIARYLPHVEIIEMHHEQKADSPSGTAIRTAELIAESRAPFTPSVTQVVETIPGARGGKHHDIPIHAVRLPGFIASQTVLFGQTGETLSIRHDAIDRQCFMSGVLLACEKVMTLNELVYGLDQIL